MIAVSQQFKEDIKNDNRLYKPIITITLTSGEVLNITEEQVMMGGVVIDESMSIGENLEIGSVNINKCTVVLNNIEESFSEYDFQDATVNVEISLDLTTGTTETIQRGIYTVDKANYDNSLVTLTCLDNLSKLDKQITESTLVYPATLGAIANDAFNVCGLNFVTQTFLNDSLVISEKPDKTLSFRTLIGFIAQMAGANVRAMPSGDIEFTWYDKEALGTFAQGFRVTEEVEDRITEDGSNYREGEITEEELPTYGDIDFIPIVYGLNTSMDDIYITGLRVLTYSDEDRDNIEFSYGALNYALTIENNDLVNESNAQRIADTVGQVVVGMRYRKAAVSHCAMPYIQVGDVASVKDRKGNDYRLLVTSLVFKINDRQSLTSTGKTPARNKAELYSRQTQLAMATNKAVTFYDENLNQEAVYKKLMGLSEPEEQQNIQPIIQPTRRLMMAKAPMLMASADDNVVEEQTRGGETRAADTVAENDEENLAIILKDGKIYLNADFIEAGSINADLIKSGSINADLITSGSLNADIIKAGVISDESGENYWNLDNGKLRLTGGFSTNIADDGYGLEVDDGKINLYFQNALVGVLRASVTNSTGQKAVFLAGENDCNVIGFSLWDNTAGFYRNKFVYFKNDDRWIAYSPILINNRGRVVYGINNDNSYQIGFAGGNTLWFYVNEQSKYYLNQSYSDKRLKKNIKKITEKYLEKISEIEIKQFVMKDDETGRPRFGIIAQDIQDVLGEDDNELIVHAPDSDILYVDNEQFLYARIAADEKKIKELEERIERLEKSLLSKESEER